MFFALTSIVFGIEITTPRPTLECTNQNCIISFANMDDKKLDEMISEDQSGILKLKFTSCQMEKIPEPTFIKLPSLLCLMITTPGLGSLEKGDFSGAADLQFLYLPGNRIRKLLKETFIGAPNLNDINLSVNEIEIVSEDAFEGLENLESLNLGRNQIAFFGQSTFSKVANLMNLDLSGNMIEFLDARLFTSNTNLNGINMANNQLLSITNDFLRILPQVKVFNAMNNPCTNDTDLENVPLIKIVDSKDRNDDENSLEKCYLNFLNLADLESTDFEDILDKAEIVQEDIELNVISDLNEQVRNRDLTIEELRREGDLLKIVITFIFSVIFFFVILKLIINVVNTMYLAERKCENNVEVVKVDKNQIIYSIQV